jgi:hypothetical protein
MLRILLETSASLREKQIRNALLALTFEICLFAQARQIELVEIKRFALTGSTGSA